MYSVPTGDEESALTEAMDQESRRRQLAGQSPGMGTAVHLAQVPYSASPGKGEMADVMPAAGLGYDPGLGYDTEGLAEHADQYAAPEVGGLARSSRVVTDGETVWFASDGPASAVDVISPQFEPPGAPEPPRHSFWSRLFRRRGTA